MQAVGVSMDDFCRAMSQDAWNEAQGARDDDNAIEQAITQIESAWKKLADTFTKTTTVDGAGLELQPCYHDSDDGDRYDDVEGGFFHVGGVYQLTPAGTKYAEKIERLGFVEFG